MLRMALSPLRGAADFRWLLCSRTVTLLGTEASEVALVVQAKQLTGSAFAVGLLGVAELVPLVMFGLYGGLLADRFDRARLLRWGEARRGWASWPRCCWPTPCCQNPRCGRCTCWPPR
jgi:MFS family permease